MGEPIHATMDVHPEHARHGQCWAEHASGGVMTQCGHLSVVQESEAESHTAGGANSMERKTMHPRPSSRVDDPMERPDGAW